MSISVALILRNLENLTVSSVFSEFNHFLYFQTNDEILYKFINYFIY